jgi:heme oxygenase (biliverdin-producing, ferredoxin)
MTPNQTSAQPTFSEELRTASWQTHEAATGAPAMQRLLAGDLELTAYTDMVAQHRYAYAVLESAAESMAEDVIAGAFVSPALRRLPALDADLQWLAGPNWADRFPPSRATADYCRRLEEVCFSWPGGFLAHHYTRYLGDLSGGQYIRRVVERVYGFPSPRGVQFYIFDGIADLKAFKVAYRQRLDATPWPPAEREAVIAEILVAYRLNAAVLEQLL